MKNKTIKHFSNLQTTILLFPVQEKFCLIFVCNMSSKVALLALLSLLVFSSASELNEIEYLKDIELLKEAELGSGKSQSKSNF